MTLFELLTNLSLVLSVAERLVIKVPGSNPRSGKNIIEIRKTITTVKKSIFKGFAYGFL